VVDPIFFPEGFRAFSYQMLMQHNFPFSLNILLIGKLNKT
jgi:hypothetical protein